MRTKPHRLPLGPYQGERTVCFTACVKERRRLFVGPEIVEPLVSFLRESAEEHGCLVPIYCFMPDHAHIMVQGFSPTSNAKLAMDAFKYRAGRWIAANHPAFRLQDDYHDHVIRRSDDWRRHAFYVFQNPVRAGFANDPYAYPFTGSIGFDLTEMLHEAAW